MPSVNAPSSPEDAESLPPINFEPVSSFVAKPLRAAFEYWNTARAGRVMPKLGDIRLDDMSDFVDHIGLVVVSTGSGGASDYFVRFAGPQVERIFGSRTGRLLSEGVPGEIAARWRSGIDMVHRSAKAIRATARVAYEGKTRIEVEVLVAPLGEESTPTAFLLAIAAVAAT